VTELANPPVTEVGPVYLELPPLSSMSRVARLTATGVAALAGFTVDELEDINVLVSEVMVALVEHGAQERISVTLEVTTDGFTVSGTTALADFDLHHPDLALCRTVLAAVSTSHGIEATTAGPVIWATLQPRRA